jgi:hypothetical protein
MTDTRRQPPAISSPQHIWAYPICRRSAIKRKARIPWLLINLVACGGWIVFAFWRSGAQDKDCLQKLRQLGVANVLYAMDHDDRLPASTRWMDAIEKYVQDRKSIVCPSLGQRGNGEYGHAFATALSGVDPRKMSGQDQRVLIFDSSNLRVNASGGRREFAEDGRGNAVFVDLHAGPVKASQISPISS